MATYQLNPDARRLLSDLDDVGHAIEAFHLAAAELRGKPEFDFDVLADVLNRELRRCVDGLLSAGTKPEPVKGLVRPAAEGEDTAP